jgi:hypothetical protein
MNRATLLAAVFAVATIANGSDALGQTAQERRVQRTPGSRIADLVTSQDQTIVLEDTAAPPLEVLPSINVSLIDWKSQVATAIVLAEIQSVDASMTSSQDWIVSNVTGSVIEVLKKSGWWNAAPGNEVTFTWNGGELLVGGTQVIAVVPGVKPIRAGQRYLIFFSGDPSTKMLMTGPTATYEWIESVGLRRVFPNSAGREELEMLPPEEVLARIRRMSEAR